MQPSYGFLVDFNTKAKKIMLKGKAAIKMNNGEVKTKNRHL